MSDLLRRSGVAPALFVIVLAAAWLAPADELGLGLGLVEGDATVPDRWTAALDGLPDDATILVGFDPDVGTYAEIRATVRTALADLLARDARLAFVSLTPEGRALLLAELERLARNQANSARLLDLGFLPGAEAALVSLTRGFTVDATAGSIARTLADEGMEAVDATLVVGGIDLGPRSWVEQVSTRVPELTLMAIAPTVLLPELVPYLESGQLDGLLATPSAGAAYREGASLGALDRLAEPDGTRALPLLVGLIAALAVLAQALAARLRGSASARPPQGTT